MNKWLKGGKQTQITQKVQEVKKDIQGDDCLYVLNVCQWIKDNLKWVAGEEGWQDLFRSRTAEQIIQDKTASGCGDVAVVFCALTRAAGIPTVFVEMPFQEWLEGDDIKSFQNHDLAKVFLAGKWYWVDPTKGNIGTGTTYNVGGCVRYVQFAEGLDSWDIGINSWGSYKEKYLAFRAKWQKQNNKIDKK